MMGIKKRKFEAGFESGEKVAKKFTEKILNKKGANLLFFIF
jgi:hypothetical protein